MTAYEWYVFFLCLIVFVLLGTLSVVAIAWIVKLTLRLIKVGAEDEKIKIEFEKLANKQPSKFWDGVEKVLSVLFCLVLFIALAFSIACNLQKQSFSSTIPTFRVVRSSSMATKDEENTYLIKNDLNDQFQAFDLILTYKMPEEKDLKLYDIVVYEEDGTLIVHRIVGIQEPSESSTDKRRKFLLQGDAVPNPDRFPVYYEQMRGIYTGQRVPFVGSFVSFLQSPAGWLCIAFVVGTLIASPLLEKKIFEAKEERWALIKAATAKQKSAAASVAQIAQTTPTSHPLPLPQPPPAPQTAATGYSAAAIYLQLTTPNHTACQSCGYYQNGKCYYSACNACQRRENCTIGQSQNK